MSNWDIRCTRAVVIRYWGALFCRHQQTLIPSSYWTRGMSRQCSSEWSSWDKPRSNFQVPLTTQAAALSSEHLLKPVCDGPWRPSQHSVTIVDTRCNESVYKSRCWLCVEWSTYSADLTEPIETRWTYSKTSLSRLRSAEMWLRTNANIVHNVWCLWICMYNVCCHCYYSRLSVTYWACDE